MQGKIFKTMPIFRRFWPVAIVGVIILILLVMVIINLSNQNYEVFRDDTHSVLLTSSNDTRQLIYEDENVRIMVGYDQFMEFGNYDEKKTITSMFTEQKSSSLEITDKYIIAKALESGKAFVLDKRHNRQVTRITVRYYEYSCGLLCGNGSRTFYFQDNSIFKLRGTQFLEVIDWIT